MTADHEDYNDWLELGIERGWCSQVTCSTHETVMTDDELEQYWEEGDDVCVFVVRLNGASDE